VQAFSSKEFRATVGAFATGVTVVTTRGEEHGYGMTANAFSSVSLDPPLILVCVINPSEGADHITRNGVFAVNILAEEQEPMSRYFASRDRPRGVDATHEAGDHLIFIGEVLEIATKEDGTPLVFHGGGYRLLQAAPGG